ncbi:hypothetical protein LXL04_014191 [Taraxacum kok-saghyz]
MHARKDAKRRKTIWMVCDKMQVQGPFWMFWKIKDLHGTLRCTYTCMHGHRSFFVMLSSARNRLNQLRLRIRCKVESKRGRKQRKHGFTRYATAHRPRAAARLVKASTSASRRIKLTFRHAKRDEKNKDAALKNAYVLMGRHELELVVNFFFHGGDIASSINVCAKTLKDEQLVLVICRLLEGTTGMQLLGDGVKGWCFIISSEILWHHNEGSGSVLEEIVEALCRHVSDDSPMIRRLCLRGLSRCPWKLCPPFKLPGPVDPQHFSGNFGTDGILEGIVMKASRKKVIYYDHLNEDNHPDQDAGEALEEDSDAGEEAQVQNAQSEDETDSDFDNGYQIRFRKCDSVRLVAECAGTPGKKPCPFFVKASWMSNERSFQIKRLVDNHTYVRNYNNARLMDPTWLARQFVKELIRKPNLKSKEMQAIALSKYHCKVSWMKCYRARIRALSLINDKLSDHYARVVVEVTVEEVPVETAVVVPQSPQAQHCHCGENLSTGQPTNRLPGFPGVHAVHFPTRSPHQHLLRNPCLRERFILFPTDDEDDAIVL